MFGQPQTPAFGQAASPQKQGTLDNFVSKTTQAPGGLFGSTGGQTGGSGQTGLFGQPQQQQTLPQQPQPSGLFGQAPVQAQQQQQNLFGAQPAQQQQAAGAGMLFGQPAQPTQAKAGLFGSTPFQQQNQPVFGQQPAPQQQQMGFFGQQQQQPMQQQQVAPIVPLIPTEQQQHQQELIDLVDYVGAVIDRSSSSCRFRGMLYSKFPKEIPEDQKKNVQNTVPLQIKASPVYIHKYLAAAKSNPYKDQLYVEQVSSIKELGERVQIVQQNMKDAQDRLEETKKTTQTLREEMQKKAQARLTENFALNQKIMTKLQAVYAKLDIAVRSQGLLVVDRDAQDELIYDQQQTINMILGEGGLQSRCENIKNQLAQVSGFRTSSDPYAHSIQESQKRNVSDDDLREMLLVLQEQKKAIEVLKDQVSDSARQLVVMDLELETQ